MKRVIAAGLALTLCASSAFAAKVTLQVPPNDDDLADALQGASLVVAAVADDDSRRRDIVAAAQADYRRLLAVMFENGYFGPVISITVDGAEAAGLPAIGTDGVVNDVVIRVESGPRFLFGRATIAPLARRTEIPESFAPGQPAGTEPIREAATAGVDGWRAVGHAKAELADQSIVARHESDRLDAALTLAPGPRLRYGPITVEGAEDVRPNQIARIADLRPGRVFDPEELRAGAQRLQRTGAFASVSLVEADRIGPDDTLPIAIQVAERLPRRIGFGGEIASDEGLAASAFWLHRNLTGYADSLRVDGQIEGIAGNSGGADYSLTFAYNRPATFNPETDLFVNGGVERLDQEDFTSNRAYIEGGARRIVSDEFQYSYGIGYEFSQTEDAFGTREFSILSLPLDLQYDRRDDPLNPADGYYIGAGLRPFYGFRIAGAGAIFDSDLRGYQGFGAERGTVLALRLQLGSVIGPSLDEIPADRLYFSGGGGTVRGFDFQSLGVELPSGDTVGGKSFLGLSGEIRQSVTESIGVVGFVDYGTISEDSDFTGGDSQIGAGVGLRYKTGIGPIRFDVGFPVSSTNDDDGGIGVYIGIGQSF